MLNGLNHITIAVSDVSISFDFYVNILGFIPKARWANGAYLCLGDLWLCLSADVVTKREDYTHYAFSIRSEDFDVYADHLKSSGVTEWKTKRAKGNQSTFWIRMDTSWKFMTEIWRAALAPVQLILMKKCSSSSALKGCPTLIFNNLSKRHWSYQTLTRHFYSQHILRSTSTLRSYRTLCPSQSALCQKRTL